MARPGTAPLASATTVPVGAMMRLCPSRVDVGVRAGLVGLHPPLPVGEGHRRVQQVPGRRSLHLVGGGSQDQTDPAQGQRPGHLGKVAVEPDDQAHPAQRRVLEAGQTVAGGEDGRLERGRVEVGLAVPGHQLAPRVEDERGVVHVPVVELGHAPGGQVEAEGPRRLGQALGARPLPRFGVVPRVGGQRLGVVAARPQLGQHHQLDAASRRVLHHAQGHREVLLGLSGAGEPLGHPDQKVPLHVPTRPTPLPSVVVVVGTLGAQRSGTVSRL